MLISVRMVRKLVARQSPLYHEGEWSMPELHLLSEVLVLWLGDLLRAYRTSFYFKKGKVVCVRSRVESLSKKYWQLLNEMDKIIHICELLGLSSTFPEQFMKVAGLPVR
jgi:hypothetical protein